MRNPVCNMAVMVGTSDITDWCWVEVGGSEGEAGGRQGCGRDHGMLRAARMCSIRRESVGRVRGGSRAADSPALWCPHAPWPMSQALSTAPKPRHTSRHPAPPTYLPRRHLAAKRRLAAAAPCPRPTTWPPCGPRPPSPTCPASARPSPSCWGPRTGACRPRTAWRTPPRCGRTVGGRGRCPGKEAVLRGGEGIATGGLAPTVWMCVYTHAR